MEGNLKTITVIVVTFVVFLLEKVSSQGRLLKPAARSTIWRVPEFQKYDAPKNYDDHMLTCGWKSQSDDPGSNCGVCGDPLSQASPRENEIGGKYYRGIIVAEYQAGDIIDVEADITAGRKGYMQWRLCTTPSNETQSCFNKNILRLADGSGYGVSVAGSKVHKVQLLLPMHVSCDHCVIQWNYRTWSNWGNCPNGTGMQGCGPQDVFRGCSDVRISSGMPSSPPDSWQTGSYSQEQSRYRQNNYGTPPPRTPLPPPTKYL